MLYNVDRRPWRCNSVIRPVALDHPMEIRTGMDFALETYCPAADGFSAARIQVVVTDTGCKVITRFPPRTSRSRTRIEARVVGLATFAARNRRTSWSACT
jgi:hypothetical protein